MPCPKREQCFRACRHDEKMSAVLSFGDCRALFLYPRSAKNASCEREAVFSAKVSFVKRGGFSAKISFVKRGGFYCPISFLSITNVPIALPDSFSKTRQAPP